MQTSEEILKDEMMLLDAMEAETGRCSRTSQSSGSLDLTGVAQCLDDCLVLLMPEEFTVTKWLEVGERIKAKGGRLAYISSNIDALQEANEKEQRQERR